MCVNGNDNNLGDIGYYETDKDRRCSRACALP